MNTLPMNVGTPSHHKDVSTSDEKLSPSLKQPNIKPRSDGGIFAGVTTNVVPRYHGIWSAKNQTFPDATELDNNGHGVLIHSQKSPAGPYLLQQTTIPEGPSHLLLEAGAALVSVKSPAKIALVTTPRGSVSVSHGAIAIVSFNGRVLRVQSLAGNKESVRVKLTGGPFEGRNNLVIAVAPGLELVAGDNIGQQDLYHADGVGRRAVRYVELNHIGASEFSISHLINASPLIKELAQSTSDPAKLDTLTNILKNSAVAEYTRAPGKFFVIPEGANAPAESPQNITNPGTIQGFNPQPEPPGQGANALIGRNGIGSSISDGSERSFIETDFKELSPEVDRIQQTTTFNDIHLSGDHSTSSELNKFGGNLSLFKNQLTDNRRPVMPIDIKIGQSDTTSKNEHTRSAFVEYLLDPLLKAGIAFSDLNKFGDHLGDAFKDLLSNNHRQSDASDIFSDTTRSAGIFTYKVALHSKSIFDILMNKTANVNDGFQVTSPTTFMPYHSQAKPGYYFTLNVGGQSKQIRNSWSASAQPQNQNGRDNGSSCNINDSNQSASSSSDASKDPSNINN